MSVHTVDKGIARGRIPTIVNGSGRRRVALSALVDLAQRGDLVPATIPDTFGPED